MSTPKLTALPHYLHYAADGKTTVFYTYENNSRGQVAILGHAADVRDAITLADKDGWRPLGKWRADLFGAQIRRVIATRKWIGQTETEPIRYHLHIDTEGRAAVFDAATETCHGARYRYSVEDLGIADDADAAAVLAERHGWEIDGEWRLNAHGEWFCLVRPAPYYDNL